MTPSWSEICKINKSNKKGIDRGNHPGALENPIQKGTESYKSWNSFQSHALPDFTDEGFLQECFTRKTACMTGPRIHTNNTPHKGSL
jgi:hypothetical protein